MDFLESETMTDSIKEVEMTGKEKLESARQVLVTEAADYMVAGYPLEKGQGTVSASPDGTFRIAGLNKDLSVVDWDAKFTRTTSGSSPNIEVTDKGTHIPSNTSLEHRQVVDTTDHPKSSKDELLLKSASGAEIIGMKGVCTLEANGASDCNYDITTKDGDTGKAHITFTPIDENTSRSTISVKTNDVDRSAELIFTIGLAKSAPTATYEYNRLSK
jgi:hypothetical protein